ncbi:MAG: sigma-54-dependent transcriptional regulator [bacterium]
MGTILLVDDDAVFRQTMGRALERRGHTVAYAENGEAALRAGPFSELDAAVIDLRMPGMDGLELLRRLREIDATLPVIVLTGHGSIATAIEAIQQGAFHYLTKPCDIPELEIYLHKAIDQRNVRRENEQLRGLIQRARDTHGIVGGGPAIRNLLNLIERMKDADAPVLVMGESGTGKELVAQALHYQGKRREHPFIAINCATLKPELLENELFGHVSGAFTGAVNRKEGLLAVAGPGTLFIDEIADMDPNVQASLLRVIETGEYRPLGSTKIYKTTVRIVAAANRDLAKEVTAQRFRQDLYYRLSVLVIPTPPLRENPDDIPLLVEAYLDRSHARQKGFQFSPGALEALRAYSWPGNVRELFNICERAVLLSNDKVITKETIFALLSTGIPFTASGPVSSPAAAPSAIPPHGPRSLDEVEKEHIGQVLEQVGNNVSRAADILRIDRRTLQRKMVKYGLRGT